MNQTNSTQIYLQMQSHNIEYWITQKLQIYIDNIKILTYNPNQSYNSNDIIILEDTSINFNLIPAHQLIVITKDIFFNEKYQIDCSLLYAPITIEKLISIIRQKISDQNNSLAFGEYTFEFSLNKGNLYYKDINIELTQTESILFKLLAQNYKENIHEDILIKTIWGSGNQSENTSTVKTHINSIKMKLKHHKINLTIKSSAKNHTLIDN